MANATAKDRDDARTYPVITRSISIAKLGRFGFGVAFAILAVVFSAASFATAEAGSRNVGVGIGVGAGLQILNQLSKGTSANKGSTKKRTATGSNKKSTKKGKQQRDNDGEANSTAKASDEPDSKDTDAGADAQSATPSSANLAAPAGAVAAPAVTGAIPAVAGPASNMISTTEEITSAQEHLRYLGYEVPAMTGVLDLNTKIAIMKFQDSIGAPSTGGLTVDQLQRLYALADERQ
jgi:hypothetical protein